MSDRSILAVNGKTAAAVYSDNWRPFFAALGAVSVERATDVEYETNETGGRWIARLRSTGAVISSGENRADVIRAEVSFLNRQLSQSKGF